MLAWCRCDGICDISLRDDASRCHQRRGPCLIMSKDGDTLTWTGHARLNGVLG